MPTRLLYTFWKTIPAVSRITKPYLNRLTSVVPFRTHSVIQTDITISSKKFPKKYAICLIRKRTRLSDVSPDLLLDSADQRKHIELTDTREAYSPAINPANRVSNCRI